MIDEGESVALYRRMKLVRSFDHAIDERRRLGKISGRREIYAGEEAVSVGAIYSLTRDDHLVSTYHERGHRLARGGDPRSALARLLGVESAIATGDEAALDSRTHFIGANDGNGLAIAAGLALALNYQNAPAIVCCLFGDEMLAQGAFHEALNFASFASLPIVFVCENNFYGMGTFIDNAVAQEELYRLAGGYKMPGVRVDGMDVLGVSAAMIDAAQRARDGEGPSLIEAVTYRWRGPAFSDAADYDARREEPIWRERDPILNLRARLVGEKGVPESTLDEIDREAATAIDDAINYAEENRARKIDRASSD